MKAPQPKAARLNAARLEAFNKLPASSTYRLIPFSKAVVVPGFLPKTFMLIVSGTIRGMAVQVALQPLIYIKQPEYWGIEVVGWSLGGGIVMPYSVSLDISHLLGTKGIEVIGATKLKKIK